MVKKNLVGNLLLGAALLLGACSDNGSSVNSDESSENVSIAESVAPSFLKKGDKIALLSPSYRTDSENVEKTAQVLEGWGFKTVIGEYVDSLDAGKYAGTPEQRAEDFIRALRDTSVKAILCNRGGYGTIQLVDLVDTALIRKNPKWLIGFSDITTLHAMETKAHVMSIHGTMSSFIAQTEGSDSSSILLRELLKGNVPQYTVSAHSYNQKGKAEGVLVGGNMATFVPLVGSSVDVFSEDGIVLFLEEVGESLHNIDRMFNSLELQGVMKNVKGVVVGEFVDSGDDLDYESTEAMLSEYLKQYDIPVMYGFPAGHGDDNYPIVMGAKVTLEVSEDEATLAFNLDAKEIPVYFDWQKTLDASAVLPLDLRKMLSGKIFDFE